MESPKDSNPSSLLYAVLGHTACPKPCGTGGHLLLAWGCLLLGGAWKWSLRCRLGVCWHEDGVEGSACCLPAAACQKHCSSALPLPGLCGKGNQLLNIPARCWNMLILVGGKLITDWIGRWEPEMAETAFSLTMWKVSSPFLLCPPSSVLARCLRGAEAPAEGRFSVCWRSCVLFTTVGLWGLFCFILFFYICSVTVILEKIKAVHSPRQKLYSQIHVALLWRGSAPFAKWAAADLWPGGCSSVGWN